MAHMNTNVIFMYIYNMTEIEYFTNLFSFRSKMDNSIIVVSMSFLVSILPMFLN